MPAVLIALLALPLAAAVAGYVVPAPVARLVTVAAGTVSFALALVLVPAVVDHGRVAAGSLLRVDALSAVFVLATTFLYGATAIFAAGYLQLGPGPE
ncbi:MAG: proton-conducting transporter membrane subunit, partial [Acidimicrobiales bacterium]